MPGSSVNARGRGPHLVWEGPLLVCEGPAPLSDAGPLHRPCMSAGAQLAAFAPKTGWPEVETPTADGAMERAPVVVIFVPLEGR